MAWLWPCLSRGSAGDNVFKPILSCSFSTIYASAAGNEHLKFGLQFEVNSVLSLLFFSFNLPEYRIWGRGRTLPVIFITVSNIFIFVHFEASPTASINQHSSLRVALLCSADDPVHREHWLPGTEESCSKKAWANRKCCLWSFCIFLVHSCCSRSLHVRFE